MTETGREGERRGWKKGIKENTKGRKKTKGRKDRTWK